MTPDDPRHGTYAGYTAHKLTHKEPACEPCTRAAARYEQTRQLERLKGIRRLSPATGTARRIQALVAQGYTLRDLATHCRVSHDMTTKWAKREGAVNARTARLVAAVYDELSMSPPSAVTAKQRRAIAYAKTVAARNGWVGPLAWDDIDDPSETPKLDAPKTGAIDEAVVIRILSGERLPSTPTEKGEVIRRWVAAGRSTYELEQITGWKPERYYRASEATA